MTSRMIHLAPEPDQYAEYVCDYHWAHPYTKFWHAAVTGQHPVTSRAEYADMLDGDVLSHKEKSDLIQGRRMNDLTVDDW